MTTVTTGRSNIADSKLIAVINNLLEIKSPSKVMKVVKRKYNITSKQIKNRTGIDLIQLQAAIPPRKPTGKAPTIDPKLDQAALAQKYPTKVYKGHAPVIYGAALNSAWVIGHALTCDQMFKTGLQDRHLNDYFKSANGHESLIVKAKDGSSTQVGGPKVFGHGLSQSDPHLLHFAITDKFIETKVSLVLREENNDVTNTFNVAFAIPSEYSASQKKAFEVSQRIIKTYFPNYKTPTSWKFEVPPGRTEEEAKYTPGVFKVQGLEDTTVIYSLEELASNKFRSPHIGIETDEETAARLLRERQAKKAAAGTGRGRKPKEVTLSATTWTPEKEVFKLDDSYFFAEGKGEDKKITSRKKFPAISASIALTMKGSKAHISDDTVYYAKRASGGSTSTSGELSGAGGVVINIPVEMVMTIRWPLDYAYFVTGCETKADFIPFVFLQYVLAHRWTFGTGRKRGIGSMSQVPERISHFGQIKRAIAKEKKTRQVPPRGNEDDFVILGIGEAGSCGDIIWVPKEADKVDEYIDYIKKTYNPAKNAFTFENANNLGNSLVLTDWHHQKFNTIRQRGVNLTDSLDISGLQTYNLIGCIPLDSVSIWQDLSQTIKSYSNKGSVSADSDSDYAIDGDWELLQGSALHRLIVDVTKYCEGTYGHVPSESFFTEEHMATKIPGFDKLSATIRASMADPESAIKWLLKSDYPYEIRHLGGSPAKVVDDYDPRKFNIETGILKYFGLVFEDMMKNFDKINCSLSHKIQFLRYWLMLMTKYHKHYDQYRKEVSEGLKANRIRDITEKERYDPSTIKLVNLPGVNKDSGGIQPHQISAHNVLAKNRRASMLDVSTGGGKTIITLMDMMRLIYEKHIGKALVIMPNRIVANWISEVNKFSQGQINPIAITNRVIRDLMRVNGDPANADFDFSMLKRLIDSAPPNSVFITDLSFVSGQAKNIVYGSSVIRQFKIAEFLRDNLGKDYGVFIDESHTVKNMKSNRTRAVAVISTNAKVVRELSGTIISNTIEDLLGQAALANPAALGGENDFNSRYKTTTGVLKDNALDLMNLDMESRIQKVTHKKQEWAYLLPQPVENFHGVDLTANQNEYYTYLISKKQKEIESAVKKAGGKKGDKDTELSKVKEFLDGSKEGSEDGIISIMAKHFQEIETFLYSPDADPKYLAFLDTKKNVIDDDYVSPKVKKIAEICNEHFLGEKGSAVSESPRPPNKFKVIIFASRKKTPGHLMKHLPKYLDKSLVNSLIEYQAEPGKTVGLEKFTQDETNKYKILVATELSINTGLNLQMASRLIRSETLWTPGQQEQAFARIWRPSFNEKYSLKNRPEVFLDWIYTQDTLEVVKITRLVSKLIDKMRYDRSTDVKFTRDKSYVVPIETINDFNQAAKEYGVGPLESIPRSGQTIDALLNSMKLPVLKMNKETFALFAPNEQKVSKFMKRTLEYFRAYSIMQRWEDGIFAAEKEKNPTPYAPVDSNRYTIPGSARLAFIPRVPNVDPKAFDLDDKMGYRVVSVLLSAEEASEMNVSIEDGDEIEDEEYDEVSEDEEDSDGEEGGGASTSFTLVTLEGPSVSNGKRYPGSLVDTPYGIGNVTNPGTRGTVKVDIVGLGEISVSKSVTWLITNEDAIQEIQAQINQARKSKGSMARIPGQLVSATAPKASAKAPISVKKPVIEQVVDRGRKTVEEVIEEDDDAATVITPDDEDNNPYSLHPLIIDGQIGLMSVDGSSIPKVVLNAMNAISVPDYYMVGIRNVQALQDLLKYLQENFTIDAATINNFRPYLKLLREDKLDSFNPNEYPDTIRFFRKELPHPTAADKAKLKPFPIVWNGKLKLAVVRDARMPAYKKFYNLMLQRPVSGVTLSKQIEIDEQGNEKEVNLHSGMNLALFRNKDAALKILLGLKQAKETKKPDNLDEAIKTVRDFDSRFGSVEPPKSGKDVLAPKNPPRLPPKTTPKPEVTVKDNAKKPAPKNTQVKVVPAPKSPTQKVMQNKGNKPTLPPRANVSINILDRFRKKLLSGITVAKPKLIR